MYYKKIISGDTIIEFTNSWTGEETVIINGQVVSKKSSVWGTHHIFSVLENGESVNYVLTTKVDGQMRIYLDLKKNGAIIQENIPLRLGTKPIAPKNTPKIRGLHKLKEFDLDDALKELKKALIIDDKDPEIYLNMACVYSIKEDTINGFECLKKAVENKLHDISIIRNHEMLAFLRIQDGFEDFEKSNFTKFDKKSIKKEK